MLASIISIILFALMIIMLDMAKSEFDSYQKAKINEKMYKPSRFYTKGYVESKKRQFYILIGISVLLGIALFITFIFFIE